MMRLRPPRARALLRRLAGTPQDDVGAFARSSAEIKLGLRQLQTTYAGLAAGGGPLPSVWDTGFRVFSQFDEDGVLLFLLAVAGTGPRLFLEIGAGDGVSASNCANLALSLGFHGAFFESDWRLVARGRAFYAAHEDTRFWPPVFVEAEVTPENVDDLCRRAGLEGEIDVLSLDVDGNEYWLWAALRSVRPRIVIVETHVEFGLRSIVVPYDERPPRRRPEPLHAGAGPAAMTTLAQKLGYRLVGANRFGFNAFYLRNDLAAGVLPAIAVEDLLRHPRTKAREALFERIRHLPFETV